MMLEATQYSANPLGNCRLKTKNISGIIHNIIWLCCCWVGSGLGSVDIFCCTHMDTAVNIGSIISLSGLARSNHRNWFASGTALKTIVQEE